LCPATQACLARALQLDAAHRRGEDLYGVTGVYGGVWFRPGRQPETVPHGPVAA